MFALTIVEAGAVVVVSVIVVVGIGFVVGKPFVIRFSNKLGSMEATLHSVDRAVNSQPKGKPTLYEQAETAASATHDVADCKRVLNEMGPQIVEIGGKLERHLNWHRTAGE